MPIEGEADLGVSPGAYARGLSLERAHELDVRLEELFAAAGCHGWLCVQSVDRTQE